MALARLRERQRLRLRARLQVHRRKRQAREGRSHLRQRPTAAATTRRPSSFASETPQASTRSRHAHMPELQVPQTLSLAYVLERVLLLLRRRMRPK